MWFYLLVKQLKLFITSQVTQFGTDWVEVEVKVPATGHASLENAGGMAQGITITTIKEKDAEEIKKFPILLMSMPVSVGQEVVTV